MKYLVEIIWNPIERGGRKNIPETGIYYCNTKLKESDKVTLWSIALEFHIENTLKAVLSFLVDSYPKIIKENYEIVLLEGPTNIVGHALVLKVID